MKFAIAVFAFVLTQAISLMGLAQPVRGARLDEASERIARLNAECEKGMYVSCFNLGVMFEEGKEVPTQKERAAKLYERACDGGHADACSNLGVLHESG